MKGRIFAISICLLFLLSPLAAIPMVAEDNSRMPAGDLDHIVLGELFTGTWCHYCQFGEQAMDNIVNDNNFFDGRFVLIEWHTGDTYECSDSTVRKNYYSVSGYPTAKFDGEDEVRGAGDTSSAEANYKSKINGRPQKADAFLEIDAVLKNGDTQLAVWVNSTLLKDTQKTNLKLYAALIEDEDFWDGNYPIRMTGRDLVISTSVQMSEKGDTGRAQGTASIDGAWNVADLSVVAWLQSDQDKEVLQAGINYFSVNDAPTVQGSAPSVVMDEDTTDKSIDMDDYFTDPESDPITYWFVQGSDHIAASFDAQHVVTITPEAEWSGTETITLQAADAANCPAEVECQVTVNNVNDEPVKLGSLPNINLLEGQTKDAYNLYDYFDDIDDLDLTFTATGQDQVTVTVKASGLVVLTAPTGWSGEELITFKAEDAGGLFVEDDSLVTVQDVNHAPTQDLKVPNVIMDEDMVDTSIDLDDHFSDFDGDMLQFTISGNMQIAASVGTDNVITLTPQANWNGEEQLTITVTDGTNTPLTDSFYVTVEAVNDPPELTGAIFEDVEIDEDDDHTTTIGVNVLFTDMDGDNLLYTLEGGDERMEIILNQDLTVSFEPSANWYGSMDYTVKATDGQVTVDYTATVIVASVNDPVLIDSQSPTTTGIDIRETDSIDFSIMASDADGVEPNYIWTVDSEVVSTDGPYYTFDTDHADAGTHSISVKATDGETEKVVTWTVRVKDLNRKPTVTITSPTEGAEFKEGDIISFAATAEDPDDDTLTFKWTLDSRKVGDQLEFTEKATPGEHTIKITVTDSKGGQAEAVVNIKVKADQKNTGGIGAEGSILSTAMIGAIIAVIIIIVVITLVAMKMRKPKDPAPTEQAADGPPPPPPDMYSTDYDQGGYDQGGYDQGYDQGGYYNPSQQYEPPPPPPPGY